MIVGTALALIACGVMVHNYGVSRYNSGVLKERAAWNAIMLEAASEANRLRAELRAATTRQDTLSAQLRLERSRELTRVQTEIQNAATTDDKFRIYSAHASGLRNDATERLARARADYLSSLGSDGSGTPGDDRSPRPVADASPNFRIRDPEGIRVGNGLGQR